MSSLKNKMKINNSYESEPSSGSGSGSYLSEYFEHCSVEEGEKLNLPNLLKPPAYDDVVVANTTSEPPLTTTHSVKDIHKEPIENVKEESLPLSKECEIRFGIPVHSRQETIFPGFTGSPLGKIKKLLQTNQEQHTDLAEESLMDNEKLTIIKSFYDITIAENSCNAVDIPLSREKPKSPEMYNTEDCNRADLSFNGKIKVFNINKEEEEEDEQAAPENPNNPNKSWRRQFSDSFTLKKYSNEKSPDLFAEDDESNNEERPHIATVAEQNVSASSHDNPLPSAVININKRNNNYHKKCQELCRRDESMQERIRQRLSGVLPPPSVTIPQLDMFEAVLSRKDEILNFFKTTTTTTKTCPENQKHNNNLIGPSLLKPTCSLEEAKSAFWPDILSLKQHGLSYNLCQASESNEYLSLSVIERFIGAETASSYRNSTSNPKKQTSALSRNNCQSPGNRLSHLARRRAIFSSANLANNSLRTQNQIGPQILLHKRKSKTHSKGNTPKRQTPGSKKKLRKTPGSSARKRLFRSETNNPTAPTVETLKRALFQSPPKQETQTLKSSFSTAQLIKSNQRVEKSKRALLFSPEKGESQTFASYFSSPHSSNQQPSRTLKRKRDTSEADLDDSVDLALQSSKLFKATNESGGLTPRALNIKSQSFCMGGSSSTPNQLQQQQQQFSFASNRALASNSRLLSIESNSTVYAGGSKMQRAFSDTFTPTNSLTENQKKKLLWAVSQALQEKKITVKHDNFKQYATILARVVRRIFQQYYQKTSTSNSETMLRLAKRYVYQVMQGFSLDDIYIQAKQQIEESRRPNTKRLSGYIGPLEYEQLQQQEQETKASSSISLKQNTTTHCQNIFSQSFLTTSQPSHNDVLAVNTSPCATLERKGAIATNANLQNSSSKSNLNGSVLRENVDCVRSAQKSFTGKDQRNMSPYAGNNMGAGGQSSAVKIQAQPIHINSAKARRQITFDN